MYRAVRGGGQIPSSSTLRAQHIIGNAMLTDPSGRPSFSNALYQEMKDLIASCGAEANRHDLAIVAIEASLDNGINTKRHLIGFLQHLGFDRGHIANLLKFETASRRWQCIDGIYSTRREPAALAA
ncbi:hypothetical protein [Sphingopyxis fribergensis]